MKRFVRDRDGARSSRGASSVWPGLSAVGGSRGLVLVLILGLLAVFVSAPGVRTEDSTKALLLDLKGAITFVSASQVVKALEKAKVEKADLLIVRLDTPGGLLSSTRDMIQAMLASSVPIIVYVAPSGARAASAGTYIVYASHLAAMAPGTHLGAATPVSLGAPGLPGSPPPSPGSEKPSEPATQSVLERKAVNDAVAYLRSLAELRGRNADWAEKAVRDASTLTATDALKERVIEVLATDIDELLTAIDGRSVTTTAGETRLKTKGMRIVELKPDWITQVLSVITDPDVAFILLLIGLYGILFEFMSPGAVAPGVIGGISLVVALTALSILPVSYGGLALLLLGIALMVLEASAPSFGALGVGGVVAFVVGALFLFDPTQSDMHFGVGWPVIAGTAAASLAFFLGVLGLALRARRRPVRTGGEEMIGSTGEVVSWSEQTGQIRVHGEIWVARSEQNFSIGQKVRVVGRVGLVLIIEEVH